MENTTRNALTMHERRILHFVFCDLGYNRCSSAAAVIHFSVSSVEVGTCTCKCAIHENVLELKKCQVNALSFSYSIFTSFVHYLISAFKSSNIMPHQRAVKNTINNNYLVLHERYISIITF